MKITDTGPLTVVSVYSWMQENLSFITDRSLQHEMATFYLAVSLYPDISISTNLSGRIQS